MHATPIIPINAPRTCTAKSCCPAKAVHPCNTSAYPSGQFSSRSRKICSNGRLFWNNDHNSSNHIERSSACRNSPTAATPSTAVLAQIFRCAGSCVCSEWISWPKVPFARAERANLEDDACHQNHVRVRRELPGADDGTRARGSRLKRLVRDLLDRHVA